ncbi:MAG TPA: hypothetical protein VE631_04300 [Alphaproteobacteria bacterium]|nr:hypothetical protein [Alphaproteobacteria bacterium]
MAPRPDPAIQITRIEAALQDLERRLAGGERIDADGVARNIGALCEQLAAMPATAARPHAPALQGLIGSLDRLERQLTEAQAEFNRRIEALGGADGAKA